MSDEELVAAEDEWPADDVELVAEVDELPAADEPCMLAALLACEAEDAVAELEVWPWLLDPPVEEEEEEEEDDDDEEDDDPPEQAIREPATNTPTSQ